MNEAQALAPVSFIKGGRMKKLKVYLAGPISKGDRGHNLAQFISWHEYLMTAGFAVFNPGLSMLLPWAADKSHSQWMEADIPFVLQSDLVVRLPGESVGADQEVAEAMKAGIPVYFAPEKPADKPRSLSLERFVREAKALVSDGYVFTDPSKPMENGTMYRLLQNYGDAFSVSRAQAFGSGIRNGVAIAIKPVEVKPAQARPEVAAGTAVVEVKKPEPKFKKGDRVQVHGASIAKYYTGPFPATGTVGQVFPDTDCDVVVDGHGGYTFTEANLTLLPSYPAKVTAHGTDWHLATAADIGKPCYMMFPANNPPGALPKIEPGELGHIVKEVHACGKVISSCGSKAPAAYVPEKIPAKNEDIKAGDFVRVTGECIYKSTDRVGTIQKVKRIGYVSGFIYIEGIRGCFDRSNVTKAIAPPGWRFLTENEKIKTGDMVSWYAEAEHLIDPERLLYIATECNSDFLSTPLQERAIAFRRIEEPAKPQGQGTSTPVAASAPGNGLPTPQPGQDHPTKGKAPDPEPGFRLLHPDEPVKKGDQFKDNWKWSDSLHWAGNDNKQSNYLWYRRPGSSTVTEAASQSISPSVDTPPQAAVYASFKKFASGAVRSSDADDTRFDLVSPIGLERLAMTCAEGAEKYGDHNWTKGMPVSECLNHCLRHVNMYLAGDNTEDHLAHAAWNLFAVMHFERVKPDLVDVPTRKERK